MRHGKRINHLGRTSPHRKAMLSNMASSLILHKRISTTVAKAKELRKYVEPLLTKSKEDTTHSRRQVFSYLQNKESVKTLFDEVAEKIATRPGGYTRIIKLGNRLGDNADMCMIELVDYNELLLSESTSAKSKKRTRRAGKKTSDTEVGEKRQASAPAPKPEAKETAVVEEKVEPEAEEKVDAVKASTDVETDEKNSEEGSASQEGDKKKDE